MMSTLLFLLISTEKDVNELRKNPTAFIRETFQCFETNYIIDEFTTKARITKILKRITSE